MIENDMWTRRRYCILAVALLVALFFAVDCALKASRAASISDEASCSEEAYRRYIERLCRNYSNGLVPGTLCSKMCTSKEIKYLQCLGHKEESIVALAEYGGHKLVLKAELQLHDTIRVHFKGVTQKQREAMNESLSNIAGILHKFYNFTSEMINVVLSECDIGNDGYLTFREATYCWHLVDQDELIISLQLEKLEVVPRFYGTCGNVLFNEYVSPVPFELPLVKDVRSWRMRARLALGFIEMIEKLEETGQGTLYLCDFKESNFGVAEIDGRYVVKSIDNDLSIFESSLKGTANHERNNSCVFDDDCSFIHCIIKCDRSVGKCSGKLASNNLQLLCRRLLMSRNFLMKYPLLHDPPLQIASELSILLDKCAYPVRTLVHSSRQTAREFKELLERSLKL